MQSSGDLFHNIVNVLNTNYIHQLSVTKYLRSSPLKEERLISTYSFRGFGHWSLSPIASGCWQKRSVYIMAAGKQRERQERARNTISPSRVRSQWSDFLPQDPAYYRSHHLPTALQAGRLAAFSTWTTEEHSGSKP